jgi:hypothetical protein
MPAKRARRVSSALRQQPSVDLATELEIVKHVEGSEDKVMKRLDEVATELRDKQSADQTYLNERINTVESNLSKKIDTHTENLTKHFDESIDKLDRKWDTKITGIDTRVSALEKWRWLLVGGGLVVLWIFSQLLIDKLFLH